MKFTVAVLHTLGIKFQKFEIQLSYIFVLLECLVWHPVR